MKFGIYDYVWEICLKSNFVKSVEWDLTFLWVKCNNAVTFYIQTVFLSSPVEVSVWISNRL